MVLCGNYEVEHIIVHPSRNLNEAHCIEITKDKDAPIFSVTYCCDEDWIWEFVYTKTNYEVVKYLIMASIVECDTMRELIDMLDETFADECEHMICDGVEIECDGDCACCEFCEEAEEVFECDGDCNHCEYNFDI